MVIRADSGRTSRRSVLRTRVLGTWMFLAACCALSAAFVVLVRTAGAVDDLSRYRSATACEQGAAWADGDCVRTARYTVTERHERRRGKDMVRSVRLAGADGTGGRAGFDSAGPVFRHLRVGDQVLGEFWRGEVVSVRHGAAVQRTEASPVDKPLFLAGFGFVLVGTVCWAVTAGWCRLRHPVPCDTPHRTAKMAWMASGGVGLATTAALVYLDVPGEWIWLLPPWR
ncbi:hypothetical protein V1460_21525 [Streptomyces sp. SCSIO 30461]|uniref:hypothetical protein n=1 Tax=Streptomyces sp. SCSIO 30461 TaxID=3118085 RepID=UPI0030D4AD70